MKMVCIQNELNHDNNGLDYLVNKHAAGVTGIFLHRMLRYIPILV